MKRVLLGLLLIPLLDALFLVYVASQLGAPLTVALVVLTALVGTLFVRAEGRHTVRRLQKAVGEGNVPTDELTDGALLIAAGAFLLTPGLVTDTLGFLLAFPPSRILVREAVQKWVVKPYVEKKTGGFASGNVYTFGFPNAEDVSASGTGAGAGGASASGSGAGAGGSTSGSQSRDASEDTYRVDDDAYDIEFEDDETDG
ncbi:membrane protein FxsA [Halorussus gelatinilyticus]|uniref:Membrane protein FxsA n=1 Tax=Halorussus gelatinilyticus TaxID=2937524 RepID=A0A8U0IJI1_9EURY|nr:FxsA family protein [Halorussus gelatinilyticus]UPW00821.1 membrane protein FxsA [Halorussus gelatinilyticus]